MLCVVHANKALTAGEYIILRHAEGRPEDGGGEAQILGPNSIGTIRSPVSRPPDIQTQLIARHLVTQDSAWSEVNGIPSNKNH